ncbi:E3 ubiquitin-protein ligase SINAT2-like [Populus alba x Populus x berolinensis]|nr:E3 ubiquitin-protein ligase SINAT2-like [Populus alba x Populus x berolinensis]
MATSAAELRGSHFRKAATPNSGNLGKQSTGNMQDLLDCPVCFTMMYPPIFQCPNGHTLCSQCRARVKNSCPICRGELGNIRCLALEKISESIELPCTYQSAGCCDIFPYYSKPKHEENCKYRPYNCPYAGAECSVTGDISLLIKHLKNDHKVDMHDGCTFNHRYVKSDAGEIDNATWMLTVFNCFGRQFCLHFETFFIGMSPVYMAFLRFMGTEDEAREFSYSIEVGGNGRKLTWQGVPRSIRDSHQKVRDSQDGLIIQRNLALFFSGGDRQELKLKVSGRIWKEHKNLAQSFNLSKMKQALLKQNSIIKAKIDKWSHGNASYDICNIYCAQIATSYATLTTFLGMQYG